MDIVLIRKYLCGKNRLLPRASHTFSLLGIIIGVTALLIVSSVMNGFEQDMMQRVISSRAEIRIISKDRSPISDYEHLVSLVRKDPGVLAVSPVINQELLAHKGEATTVVNAFGIDFEKHNELISMEEQIKLGKYDQTAFETDGVMIGLDLSLSLNATVGEYVQFSSPVNRVATPFGLLPKMKRLRVIGIFVSGMPEYDQTYAYMSLENSRFFTDNIEGVNLLQVKTVNPKRSGRYAASLRKSIDDEYLVEDWSMFEASLFQAMQLEKGVMFAVLAMMLIISGFNMAGNSLKTVTEKKNEIGILKALGMNRVRINRFFIGINLFIGLTGTIIGVVTSLVFIFLQNQYRLVQIPVPGFPMQWLPVVIQVADFIVVPLIVITICLLATVISLQKIKDIDPIRIIRELE